MARCSKPVRAKKQSYSSYVTRDVVENADLHKRWRKVVDRRMTASQMKDAICAEWPEVEYCLFRVCVRYGAPKRSNRVLAPSHESTR